MRAQIFTTNENGEYVSGRISNGSYLSGVTNARKNADKVNTNFYGFGVAITGSSCYNLSLMEKTDREKLLKTIYSKEGLNLGVGRLSIGSSDYSAEVYSYDDVENDIALEHFSIERDKEYIIPMIKEILTIRPDLKLFASPWSPPGWMKTGGSMGGGFMREKFIDCYADYIVKFIKAYADEGITVSAVTTQNESETDQHGNMPACFWHPDIESKFIGVLRRKFDENGIDTKIWCYDHNFSGVNRVDWCFKEYPKLKEECAGVAFHYYRGSIEQTAFLKELYPGLELHFTEGGPRLYDNYSTDWCKWTLMAIKTLCSGYSSLTGWNLMLDETGGPNVGPYYCGGFVTRNYGSGELSYSGQYKAFRHFAGISSDSRIYPLTFERSQFEVFTFDKKCTLRTEGCIIESESGKAFAVLVNPSEKKEQIQLFYGDKCWYVEMLPNTSATVVFEE